MVDHLYHHHVHQRVPRVVASLILVTRVVATRPIHPHAHPRIATQVMAVVAEEATHMSCVRSYLPSGKTLKFASLILVTRVVVRPTHPLAHPRIVIQVMEVAAVATHM